MDGMLATLKADIQLGVDLVSLYVDRKGSPGSPLSFSGLGGSGLRRWPWLPITEGSRNPMMKPRTLIAIIGVCSLPLQGAGPPRPPPQAVAAAAAPPSAASCPCHRPHHRPSQP